MLSLQKMTQTLSGSGKTKKNIKLQRRTENVQVGTQSNTQMSDLKHRVSAYYACSGCEFITQICADAVAHADEHEVYQRMSELGVGREAKETKQEPQVRAPPPLPAVATPAPVPVAAIAPAAGESDTDKRFKEHLERQKAMEEEKKKKAAEVKAPPTPAPTPVPTPAPFQSPLPPKAPTIASTPEDRLRAHLERVKAANAALVKSKPEDKVMYVHDIL